MRYSTKELSPRTWADFEDLFTRGNGWDFCACMLYQRGHHLSSKEFPNRAGRGDRGRAEKRELVGQGRAHGILVYVDDRAVGWCQYGPVEELPIGGRGAPGPTDADWRITCFVTEKQHRRAGVARRALRAALAGIGRRGGGLVEAYPVATLDPTDAATAERHDAVREWNRVRSQLIRAGKPAEFETHEAQKPAFEVDVAGVGRVVAWNGPDQQLVNCGTVSMFAREGFTPVAVRAQGEGTVRRPPPRVIMRKQVDAR